MIKKRVSPAELEGKSLDDWYRRTPGEIEAERAERAQDEYDEFFGQGPWQEARARRPPAVRPPVRRALPPSKDAPAPEERDSFFQEYPIVNGVTLTGRPYPLNTVLHVGGDEFQLADGSVVRAAELEAIYAEQKQRMAGEDEEPVAARVRLVDRVPTGKIPDAATMAQDDREEDPSCHPYGGWEREQPDPARSQRSRDYEAQINRAPGLNYVVRAPDGTVAFDGCAVWDPKRQLLEAKGPRYAALAAFMDGDPRFPRFNEAPRRQARRQAAAASGRPVDWHIAEKGAVPFFEPRVEIAPYMKVHHTPLRTAGWKLF